MVRPKPGSPASLYPGWPDSLDVSAPEHAMIQAMVINLRRERNRYRSVKGVAEKAGVAASTISDILNGNSWPTLETVARLEVGLGVRLWPGVKTTRGNT